MHLITRCGTLLLGAGTLFFFIVAAMGTRPTADDLFFYMLHRDYGIFDSLLLFQQNKRMTSHFLAGLVYLLSPDFSSLVRLTPLYFMVSIAIAYLGLMQFLAQICRIWGSNPWSWVTRLALSGSILFYFFLLTHNPAEVWFWISGSTSYFWSLCLLIWFGVYFLKALNGGYKAPAFLLALLNGGLVETAGIQLFFALGVLLLFQAKEGRKFIVFCMIGVAIFPIAQLLLGGIEQRFHSVDFSHFIWERFFDRVILSWDRYVAVALLGLFISLILTENFGDRLRFRSMRQLIGLSSLVLFSNAFITCGPLILIFGDAMPLRTLFSFDLALGSVLLIFLAELLRRVSLPFQRILAPASLIVSLALVIAYGFTQLPRSIQFSKAYEGMLDEVVNAPMDLPIIRVAKLPDPGVIAFQSPSAEGVEEPNITSKLIGKCLGVDKLVFTKSKSEPKEHNTTLSP